MGNSEELMVDDLIARLHGVKGRIVAACERADRDPGSVRLLPVSKTHSADAVRALMGAGCTRFAENRVQEMAAKADEVSDAAWTLIGHLQSNKAKLALEVADEFQALDSLKLAQNLDARLADLDRTLRVCVEVNTSGEESKHGLKPADVPEFARALAQFPRLDVTGLMTVAIPGPDQDKVAACFETLAGLAADLRADHVLGSEWRELSMGMSGDFELAIEHGATCVRVGTAIFGARDYSA